MEIYPIYKNLNVEQLKRLANGEKVRPYPFSENIISIYEDKFLLEIYEFTTTSGVQMYSVFDTFNDLVECLKYCSGTRSDNTSVMYEHRAKRR